MSTAAPLVERPSWWMLGAEPFRAAIELASHLVVSRQAAAAGDGHAVVIFPGLGADGTSVAPLRSYCRELGYDAYDWGRGFNTGPQGDMDEWLAQLAEHVQALLATHTLPATLIGWSLGGIYAREIAKLLTPGIRQVITIGTPFNATTDHTHAGWLYRLLNGTTPVLDRSLSQRLRTPPGVPTTSIYSRSDGVVAWQTCRHERRSRLTQDIEIRGSHVGMGWNRSVMRVVADRLAQPLTRWRPYVMKEA
jgi:hypothetical protein